ncbi:hypothetical protein CRENBAI_010015 [Crenichthys baileyi]|uniref:Uncharacterized protein n=1 Tax=Crenichthys baileyi TaxID=28760 RepID=A0AAV9R9H4_9TELE
MWSCERYEEHLKPASPPPPATAKLIQPPFAQGGLRCLDLLGRAHTHALTESNTRRGAALQKLPAGTKFKASHGNKTCLDRR